MNKEVGKIISIGDTQTFDSGAKKLSFQIETVGQYPKKISFDLFKGADNVKHLDSFLEFNKVGNMVEVEFILESREYNGKWYTNASMWSCKKVNEEVPTAEQMSDDGDDDLPF